MLPRGPPESSASHKDELAHSNHACALFYLATKQEVEVRKLSLVMFWITFGSEPLADFADELSLTGSIDGAPSFCAIPEFLELNRA